MAEMVRYNDYYVDMAYVLVKQKAMMTRLRQQRIYML